jgi:drug/metabolite transporter (DMT)-like permease
MQVRVIAAFAVIFIVWGSTYLAIRYAVEEIPPLLTAGVRHLIAGGLLFAWARWQGHRASWLEWRHSAVVGALFFLIGHGTLHWAEQSVPSGLSALLIATEPVWIAVFLAVLGQSPLRLQNVAGLLLGLAGVWVLVGVESPDQGGTFVAGTLAILVGAATWGMGVVYSQRAPLPANPMLRTATTLLCGAGLLLAASTALGEYERVRMPSALALSSLAYLIVFGSMVAFTAYYWLLDRYPATLVATHTYVNPAVAVFLGWAFGGEALSASLLLGLLLVGGAIALVGAGEPARKHEGEIEPPLVESRS